MSNRGGGKFGKGGGGGYQSTPTSLPIRPSNSPSGSGTLLANHFRITIPSGKVLYRYDITDVKAPPEPAKSTPKSTGSSSNPPTQAGQPRTVSVRVRKRVIWLFIQAILAQYQKDATIASNYKTTLISSKRLQVPFVGGSFTEDVLYYDENRDQPDPSVDDGTNVFTVTIKEEPSFNLDDLMAHLKSPNTITYGQKEDAINALQIVFSHRPFQHSWRTASMPPTIAPIGMNKFFLLKVAPLAQLGKGCIARVGFFRSVRNVVGNTAGLDLNVNRVTSAFYKSVFTVPGTNRTSSKLLHLLDEYFDGQNWRSANAHIEWHKVNAFLKGLRVKTNYVHSTTAPGNNPQQERWYTCVGFPREYCAGNGRPATNIVRFRYAPQGVPPRDITVSDYYRERYPVTTYPTFDMGHPQQWVVQVGSTGTFIPISLLDVIEGQPVKGQLPTDLIDKLVPAATPRFPSENYRYIIDHGQPILGFNDQQDGPGVRFGLTIDPTMAQVKGTILPPPPVAYRNRQTPQLPVTLRETQQGGWNLRDRWFSKPLGPTPQSRPKEWTHLVLHYAQNIPRRVDNFLAELATQIDRTGITHLRRRVLGNQQSMKQLRREFRGRKLSEAEERDEIADLTRRLTEMKKAGVHLVVVLLPDKDADHYSLVKRVGDQFVGIQTVCVVCKDNSDRTGEWWGPAVNPGHAANLAMKINLKLDKVSANQIMTDPGPILDEKTMVVGLDVTHPGIGAMVNAPSVAAVVASMDANFAQWPAVFRENPPLDTSDPKEVMEEIMPVREMMQTCLNRFWDRRKFLPAKIILYRDGLSEGQFDMARDNELKKIKQAIDLEYDKRAVAKPKLALICCVKRNQTRFFSVSKQSRAPLFDDKDNPKPGCFVEDRITYGDHSDFFLISHGTLQGVARPTHYVVLEDELKVPLQDIARMTHNLCYLFGRATRSVGVVTPAYYADLATQRARQYFCRAYGPIGHPNPMPDFTTLTPNARPSLDRHPDVEETMFYI